MEAPEVSRATAAAMSVAASLGLTADDATVLQNSNALTLRLLPCDVLARVAPEGRHNSPFQLELAQRLAEAGGPTGVLDPRVEPRVYERDGFAITFWTFYEPMPREVSPGEYADALGRLHTGMRKIDVATPHFLDRVGEALRLVDNRDLSPDLMEEDRDVLGHTLRSLRRSISERGAPEQLLHGEPHPGNMLTTKNGLLFIDLETCCHGPVEFDIAHAPAGVSDHYPGIDKDLLRECRILMLAIITMWRWDKDDQLPNGHELAAEWLVQIKDQS